MSANNTVGKIKILYQPLEIGPSLQLNTLKIKGAISVVNSELLWITCYALEAQIHPPPTQIYYTFLGSYWVKYQLLGIEKDDSMQT